MSKLIQYAPIDGAADQVSTLLLRYSVQLAPVCVLVLQISLAFRYQMLSCSG